MAVKRSANWFRTLCIFFLFISPISGCASFWDNFFGENPIEDSESIFEAIQKERVGNVERLIGRRSLLEERNSEGLTPLLYAIQHLKEEQSYKGNTEKIILALIDQGSCLESTDLEGNTALLKCFTVLNNPCPPEIIKIIIGGGADLDARNNAYRTALMLAAEKNQITAVELLLAAGAFIDSRDGNGMTPLMYASYKGHIKIMQILMQNNADIGSRLISDVVIGSNEDFDPLLLSYLLPYFPFFYKNKTVVPAGSTALTFAEKCGGRGAEKIILDAWVKKDPSIEELLIEWRKKVTEL